MKQNILLLLSLCLVMLSCGGDSDDPIKEIEKPPVENKDPFITLKKTNIDFTNQGGSESVLIESNIAWTIKSSASWCTVTPSSGNKSTASITLSALANESYDSRSCTVTIEGEGIAKTITVNQGENLGLLITQDRYELGNEESTIKVEIKANVEFEVEINNEWITQVETRGLVTSALEFKIAKNDSYGNREGSITIKQKDGGMSSTITIFQLQEDAIILSDKNVYISSNSQSFEVVIKANVDVEITVQDESQGWISYASTRGLAEETLSFNVTENTTDKTRSAEVYIKDKATSLQETLTINQIGKEPGVYYIEKMGTLGSILSEIEKSTIITMVLKGEINKADFEVMKTQMPQLSHVDLKDVKCDGDKIPEKAFGGQEYSNKNISTIILPLNVATIEKHAFYDCSGLTKMEFGDSLVEIKEGAFANCSNISGKVVIPRSLVSLRENAFQKCYNIGAFRFPHTTPITFYPNMLVDIATVEVPVSSVETYTSTDGWKDYKIVGYIPLDGDLPEFE